MSDFTPTKEDLLEQSKNYRWLNVVHYHLTEGVLYWAKFPTECGKKIGTFDLSTGYLKFKYQGRMFYVHRVIFEIMYGYEPDYVDHIDGNKLNNHHENLREASPYQNQVNQPKSIKNTSGAKNVYWVEEHQKWRVRVQIQGQRFDFGYYDDFENAALVAKTARNQIHKEFANHE